MGRSLDALHALSDEGEGLKSLHALLQEKCEALGRSTLRLRVAPQIGKVQKLMALTRPRRFPFYKILQIIQKRFTFLYTFIDLLPH